MPSVPTTPRGGRSPGIDLTLAHPHKAEDYSMETLPRCPRTPSQLLRLPGACPALLGPSPPRRLVPSAFPSPHLQGPFFCPHNLLPESTQPRRLTSTTSVTSYINFGLSSEYLALSSFFAELKVWGPPSRVTTGAVSLPGSPGAWYGSPRSLSFHLDLN